MKKLTLCTLILSFCALGAEAQNDVAFDIVNPALQEMNVEQSLWFNSTNSAGMVFAPLKRYNALSLDGSLAKGDYKRCRQGAENKAVIFNTSGALQYDEFSLWGYFKFDNNFSDGTLYNALLYDVDSRNPFYAADYNSSNWKRQSYDMGFRVATPVMWNRLAFGVDVVYTSKVGAKQIDPRTKTYLYNAKIRPSAVLSLGASSRLGLTLGYERSYERSAPSVENYSVEPKVAVMRGLGFYTVALVGGNSGLETFMYSGNTYAASLQYSLAQDAFELLVDAGFTMSAVDAEQNPKQIRKMGTFESTIIDFDVQALFGSQKNQKLTLKLKYDDSYGVEHVQNFDSSPTVQKWITVSSTTMSGYSLIDAALSYDLMTGIEKGKGYDWKFGVAADFNMQSDIYYVPQSTFDATNAYAQLNVAKNIAFSSKTFLLIGLSGGYNYSLGGSYIYTGSTNTDSAIVTDFFPKELAYLTTDYLSAGAKIAFSTQIGRRTSLFINADCRYVKPASMDTDRLVANVSVGCLF